MSTNPFTERGRITDSARFIGRWGELAQIFDRLEAGRPVMVAGVAGIGRSSLLTHLTRAASAGMDDPTLRSFYLDLGGAAEAAQVYRTLVAGLGAPGDSAAALQVALATSGAPPLFCLDNAQAVAGEPWGEQLLEELARMARGGALMLAVAVRGQPLQLSERYAAIVLGAFTASEVRLLCDVELEGTGVTFTAADLREVTALSRGHPAYVQRAAFHLFRAKREPGYRWREAYLAEARDMPVPGSPLPPEVFEGEGEGEGAPSRYGDLEGGGAAGPPAYALPEPPEALLWIGAALLGLLAGALWHPAAGLAVAALGAAALAWRRSAQRRADHQVGRDQQQDGD